MGVTRMGGGWGPTVVAKCAVQIDGAFVLHKFPFTGHGNGTDLLHALQIRDRPAVQQGRGFRQVGSDQCGYREQVGLQSFSHL